jgi:hypothetical protein
MLTAPQTAVMEAASAPPAVRIGIAYVRRCQHEVLYDIWLQQQAPDGARRTTVNSAGERSGDRGEFGFELYGGAEPFDPALDTFHQFDHRSHGFRPGRGCNTVLSEVQRIWTGTRWFIEGDIAQYYDSINHDKLIHLLGKRIHDKKLAHVQ